MPAENVRHRPVQNWQGLNEETFVKINLDTKKLLGFRLYSAEAVNGKQGNKTGGFTGNISNSAGLKMGGLAGMKTKDT